MAGYSGTPLLKKLGINEDHKVFFVNSPGAMPEELVMLVPAKKPKDLDVVLLFATSFNRFKADFTKASIAVKPEGMIWAAWPKKASGVVTDLTDEAIRNHILKTPFVDVKVCAIDETWSGLKLVVRKELRSTFATAKQ